MKTEVDKLKEELRMLLFIQMIAATRGKTQMKRHKALCHDISSLIVGERPTESRELI
tara:strand:+ start:107 stop:277 length:171 start_codon:yes stop_codon:yes gene_type:complete